MKKIFLTAVFFSLFVGVYAQTTQENRWIVGTWVGSNVDGLEIIFNNNGTGRLKHDAFNQQGLAWENVTIDIIFSISGNTISIFNSDGTNRLYSISINRINDQRMVTTIRVRNNDRMVNFNKRS